MTSDKLSARMIAEALEAFGVTDVVVSPGSRNAPLILALEARPGLTKHVVVDERSAAFTAMGISLGSVSGGRYRPVAVVCTSGSAVLNYAPAVAEAYYRGVPLIVISADRPAEWIDQDDSQTIRQPGILANIVKSSYCLAAATTGDNLQWLWQRTLNDALHTALDRRPGPVHINVAFGEPLAGMADSPALPEFRRLPVVSGQLSIPPSALDINRYRKVMIVMGYHCYAPAISEACQKLAERGIAIVSESLANLHDTPGVPNTDAALTILRRLDDAPDYRPELVISTGGALVSRNLKTYLRQLDGIELWHVGCSNHVVDCFRHVSRRFDLPAADFLSALAAAATAYKSDFGQQWHRLAMQAARLTQRFAGEAPWSDFKAVWQLMTAAPACNLHLSNGTAVRYAQLFDYSKFTMHQANRGVSGIDGCTSTAVGASIVRPEPTLLITGDMSAQYDIAALANRAIDSRFKMAVLDNSGGGIFRFISPIGDLDPALLDRYFCADVNLPLRQLADAYGFDYFEADSTAGMAAALPDFFSSPRKAILRIITPPYPSAALYRNYFRTLGLQFSVVSY